jgi:hypothetical protein
MFAPPTKPGQFIDPTGFRGGIGSAHIRVDCDWRSESLSALLAFFASAK